MKFYGAGGLLKGGGASCSNPKELVNGNVTVPLQDTAFLLNVLPVDGANSHPPAIPSISAGGACITNTPHNLTFSSTDQDGDKLRYLIDWNNDGITDQVVPPTGYVPSGATQTAQRTYTTTGTQTVHIAAQDERGLTSSWASISFSCADSAETEFSSLNGNNSNNGNGNGGAAATIDLSLRAIPSLVRPGDTSQIHWSAENVESCTVNGDNGDSWDGVQSPIGGETSSPITGQTRYTLSCVDTLGGTQTKTAIVNILPQWREE